MVQNVTLRNHFNTDRAWQGSQAVKTINSMWGFQRMSFNVAYLYEYNDFLARVYA